MNFRADYRLNEGGTRGRTVALELSRRDISMASSLCVCSTVLPYRTLLPVFEQIIC